MFVEQSMDFAMRFIADRMNLRIKFLPRSVWRLIEERLNLVVVLFKQRSNPLLLIGCQLQVFRQASKLLVDGLRRINMLKLLRYRRLLTACVLSPGRNCSSSQKNHPIEKRANQHNYPSCKMLGAFATRPLTQ